MANGAAGVSLLISLALLPIVLATSVGLVEAGDVPRPEYPRPQLVREPWLNLNGEWEFKIDADGSGEERGLIEGGPLARRARSRESSGTDRWHSVSSSPSRRRVHCRASATATS